MFKTKPSKMESWNVHTTQELFTLMHEGNHDVKVRT